MKTDGASAQLERLARDYWQFRLDEEPILGIDHGHEASRRRMFRESIEDHARRDRCCGEFLSRLAAIDPEELSGQDALSAALLHRELSGARERYRLEEHLRPSMFPFGPDAYVGHAINKTVLQGHADAEDYLARLATVPQFLADCQERLAAGIARGHRLPAILLPRVVGNVESYLGGPVEDSIWYKPLRRAPVPLDSVLLERGRALIAETVAPAYAGHAAALRRLYTEQCRDSLSCVDAPQGADYYRFIAAQYTTVDTLPADIHRLGLAEVERIAAEIEATAAEAGYAGDVAGFRQRLASDPAFLASSGEALLEHVEVLAKRIDRRIPEFFSWIPRMTYGIESIPAALSQNAPPAYAQPNPADNSSAGIFWVSSLPQRCPTYMHVPLVLHEAWPGHLMHLAVLQEMQDLPDFRRHGALGYMAYLEGWALYCERLGEDMGFYGDPYSRFGRLEMEMWRALRLVIDTGIHLHGWSRQQAIDLMRGNLSQADDTIEAEVDRYIGMPGQALAYKMGELKIMELRRRAEAVLGPRFRLKDFHHRLMTAGPVTLPVLEQHLQEWIEGSAA